MSTWMHYFWYKRLFVFIQEKMYVIRDPSSIVVVFNNFEDQNVL